MSEAPQRIFLAIEDPYWGEEAWSEEKRDNDDVEYIRADLHEELVGAYRKRLLEVRDMLTHGAEYLAGTRMVDT